MAKIMGILALAFYFFAMLFGLMLYTGVGRGGHIPYGSMSKSMLPTEAEGYSTITPPSPDEIKELLEQEKQLQSQIELLEAQLNAKQLAFDDVTVRLSKLQSDFKLLDMEKKLTERGRMMASVYKKMNPEEAASVWGKVPEEKLKWMVEYAFPYMNDTTLGKIMGKADQVLTERISKILAESKSETK